jgi:DNA-binding IclR family transcriptional regulator
MQSVHSLARERNNQNKRPTSPLTLANALEVYKQLTTPFLLTRENISKLAEASGLSLTETDDALAHLLARGNVRRDAKRYILIHRADVGSEVTR